MVLERVLKHHEHAFGLRTESEATGKAREDLPQELIDVPDLCLTVLKLDFVSLAGLIIIGQ